MNLYFFINGLAFDEYRVVIFSPSLVLTVNLKSLLLSNSADMLAWSTLLSKILSLPLPQTALALPLDYLLNNYFSIQFQQDGRSCGHCSARGLQSPKLPFKEKLNISKYPQYLPTINPNITEEGN